MSPATALCLLALATVFVLSSTGMFVRRPALLGVTGLLITAVGATCSLSILTGRDDAFAWGDMTRVAFSTAAGLLLLGIGAVCVAWSRIDFAAGEPAWVPIGAGLFLATLRAGVWQAFSFPSGMNFVSDLTLFGVVFSAIVFGIFIHLLLKARLQRGALLAVNLRLETEMVERRRAEEEAHAANRAKGQFLAHMSHEIRTPINGVLGMTELVLDTDLNVDQRELLETARSSAGALVTIVNDILDFSKIEAGRLDLNPVSFRVRDAVGRIVKLLANQAEKKGVELLCDIRPEVPEEIQADPTRLSQVITNLVGNAVKFTSTGEIELRVDVDSFDPDGALLHISVRDTGIGVPADKLSSIFDPFIQADGSTTRRFGGTGLGLTVSRRLVEMMGGRIWVDSQPGQGSCFHFTCRVRTVRAETASEPAARLAGLSVLVVDDNATNRRILAGLLDSVGIRPAMAASGAEALEMIEKAAAQRRPFSLTILDRCMPEMDGFMLVEQIRERRISAVGAIVMLTSTGQRGDAARCAELGIAAHLTKPAGLFQLVEAMHKALDDAPAPAAEITDRPVSEDQTGLRILLAEDNVVNQKLAMRLLQRLGHAVTVVDNGRAALHAVERELFDVVLMDVQMPEMDGFEATGAIRQSESGTGRHLPVVAMTAHAMSGDRKRCLDAGMDGYVSKPVRPQELLAEISRVRAALLDGGIEPSLVTATR